MRLSDFGSSNGNVTAFAPHDSRSVLLACGRRLFLLVDVKSVAGHAEFTKKVELTLTSLPPADITSLCIDSTGGRVAVCGDRFVWLVQLPVELWTTPVVTELVQQRYFAESTSVHDSVFSGEATPLQMRWLSDDDYKDQRKYLAILSADCAMRIYDIDGNLGVEYPRVKVDLISYLPILVPAHSNRYGLYKTLASFVAVQSASDGFHFLIVDSDGEAYTLFACLSSSVSHSAAALDIPIEISSFELIPHDFSDSFGALVATSPNGTISLLTVLCTASGVEAVKVVDSVSLPSCDSPILLSPLPAAALLQSPLSVLFVDFSPAIVYLHNLATSKSHTAEWAGMKVSECIRVLSGAPPLSSLTPPIAVAVEDVEGARVSAVIAASAEGLHSVLLSRVSPVNPSTALSPHSTELPITAGAHNAVVEYLQKKLPPISHVGSAKSSEAELLQTLLSTVSRTTNNVELLRNAIHEVSQVVVSIVGRASALEVARDEQDQRTLQLYEELTDIEERLIKGRRTTDSLVRRANLVWSSLASKAPATLKETEMLATLKKHLDSIRDVLLRMPRVALDMETFREELIRSADRSVASRKINIHTLSEEIDGLKRRCEQLERSCGVV